MNRNLFRHAGFTASFGLLAASVPLLTNIGRNLEYEYATAVGWTTLILWPVFWVWIQDWRQKGPSQNDGFLTSTGWAAQTGLLVSSLAFPGALLHGTKVCLCSQSDFWTWVGLQVIPAAVFATAMGNALTRLTRLPRNSGDGNDSPTSTARWRVTMFWALFVVIGALQFGALLWLYPQKRAVHLLAGLVHGPVYDRMIWLHQDVILIRITHVLLALIIGIAATRWTVKHSTTKLQGLAVLSLVWLVLTIATSQSPVTGHGESLLQRQFPGKIVHEDFRLFHTMTDEAARYLEQEIIFHVSDLKKELAGIEFPTVDVYAYPDTQTKKLLFGGGTTDVTDVRTATVHLTVPGMPQRTVNDSIGNDSIGNDSSGNDSTARVTITAKINSRDRQNIDRNSNPIFRPHPTLRHELVHALTSQVAFHGLGFHPNMALTEGLAVALAPESNAFATVSLDQAALELIESGRIPDPLTLFSPMSFLSASGPRAYTVAGSLAKWVKDSFGSKTLLDIYAGKSWFAATGETGENIIVKWLRSLRDANPKDKRGERHKIQLETSYRSRGVTQDRCPHSIATILHRKVDSGALRRIYLVSNDPAFMVGAMQMDAHQLVTEILAKQKPREDAVKFAQEIISLQTEIGHWPPQSEEDIQLRILASDLFDFASNFESRRSRQKKGSKRPGKLQKLASDTAAAATMTNSSAMSIAALLDEHKRRPFPAAIARQVIARSAINSETSPLERTGWRLYLAGWAGIPQVANATEARWIYTYLRLKNLIRPRPGARQFSHGEALQLSSLSPDRKVIGREASFKQEWYKSLAIWFEQPSGVLLPYQSGQFATRAWQQAAEIAATGTAKSEFELNAARTAWANMP